MKFLAVSLALVGLAPAAHALDITSVATGLGGTNSAPLLANSGNNRMQVASSASVVTSPSGPVPDTFGSSITFLARYASLVAADREGPAPGLTTTTMTSDYTITFTVVNPTNQPYRVDIDTLRIGAFTTNTVLDDTGNTTSSLGAVTGTVDATPNAALALVALGPVVGTATGDTAINQSSTTLSIFDSALTRTFVLGFTWTASVTSDNLEAAIRLGNTTGGLGTTLADDYPGVGSRTASSDGHFVDVTVTMLPEPNTGALLAIGLLGFGMRSRLIRRSRAARGA